MPKVDLTDITTGYASADAYNANNTLIEAGFDNTISRDGTTPNTMSADLDMNSNSLNNVDVLNVSSVIIGGTSLVPGADTINVPGASSVPFTPAGNIVATDVQAAVEELDTEKAALNGSASEAFASSAFTEGVTLLSDKYMEVPTAVSGFVRAGNTFVWDGDTTAPSHDLFGEPYGAWRTVGPTGSGADIIFAALDLLPANARIADLTFQFLGQYLATGEGSTNFYLAAGGVTASTAFNAKAGLVDWGETAADAFGAIQSGVLAPMDENLIFQLYIDPANVIYNFGTLRMHMHGFIVD